MTSKMLPMRMKKKSDAEERDVLLAAVADGLLDDALVDEVDRRLHEVLHALGHQLPSWRRRSRNSTVVTTTAMRLIEGDLVEAPPDVLAAEEVRPLDQVLDRRELELGEDRQCRRHVSELLLGGSRIGGHVGGRA